MNLHAWRWNRFGAPRAVLVLALVTTLWGCAQQLIRDEATAKLREGNFEAAVQGLQAGVAQYPESTTLRAGLVAARSEVITRLVSEIAQLRAQGRFDDADKPLKRGLALDPGNDRLLALQSDLVLARRQADRLLDANALVAAGKKQQALRIVEAALRETPRQPDLTALQRRLELELRLDSGSGGRRALAETRPITLDFRNAPLSTVLDAITRGSGINFILDRDVRQDSRVTVYLRNALVEDAIELVTGAHQMARRIVDPNTVLIYPNTPDKQREHQEQVIRIFHLGSADAKQTAALLRAMLRIKEPFVDERANMISIREAPEIVALAERLVALHDVGEAEVMLEVEILEIKTSRLTELGINFPNSFTLTPLAGAGSTGLTVDSLRRIDDSRVGVGVAGLLINLKREVGDFNILANPRVRTKSREKAKILIGDKVPVITSTSSATGFVAETVNYLDVGLKLEVEPQVSPDDDVTIKLALEVSTVAREVRTSAGSLAYQIGTRNANTTLRLRDGETQLLAGLISNEDRSTSNRIPGLGDLPIAGRLFSSQKDDVQRTELVLAITPRILHSAARPDVSQAEMWVGTEMVTRLRATPGSVLANTQSTGPSTISPVNATATANAVAPNGSTAPAVVSGPVRAVFQHSGDIKAGDVFDVNIELASGTPLRGAPVEIAFPAQAVEVVGVVEGEFFKQSDGVTSFTHAVNTGTGRIAVGVLRNDATGATGKAPLLTLRLRARAAGPLELRMTSLKPIALGGTVQVADLPVISLTVK